MNEFFIYLLAVLAGLAIEEFCRFSLNAYRRYVLNQKLSKFNEAIKQSDYVMDLINQKRKLKRMLDKEMN